MPCTKLLEYLDEMKVGSHLAPVGQVTFNAGTHTESITMAYEDFVDLVKPQMARFTYQPQMEHNAEA